MAKSKAKTLPPVESLDDLVDFFDTHDMGDYWEHFPEAQFEINIRGRKHLIALEEEVVAKVTEIANARKVPSEVLINTWLKEEIRKAS